MKPQQKSSSGQQSTSSFAEVIESSLSTIRAQCWQWDHFPRFGSLVEVPQSEQIVLGMVTHIETGSMDPMRYPFPYQKTEEELKSEQPQIFEFLKTTFTIQIIGYQEQKKEISYLLPAKPCKIHAFVAECSPKMVETFFQKPDFLHLLFAFERNIPSLDELLLAILKHLIAQKVLTSERLENFCKIFTLLTGNDYRRLKLFLRRVETSAQAL